MPTQGFQLSQFSRAPQVPGNIGVVDTKSIYGSVVDALKSFEAARTAQAAQQATDAELSLAAQKAATEQALLGSESAARRANANLLAAKATEGLRGVTPEVNAQIAKNILASTTDTAMLPLVPKQVETAEAKLGAEKTLAGVMSDPELVRQLQTNKALGSTGVARQRALDTLANPDSAPFARQAAAIYLGIEPKAVQPGIGYQVLTGADGSTRLVAVNKLAVGAQDVASGEVIGTAPGTRPSMLPAGAGSLMPNRVVPTAAPAPTAAAPAAAAPAPAPAALAPTAEAALTPTVQPTIKLATDSTWLGPSLAAKASATEIAQEKGKLLGKLPALESTIRSMETKLRQKEVFLDEAEKKISAWSTGFIGNMLQNVGGTPAKDLVEILKPIKTSIFVDELNQMRANSPTGGAVGNVTDTEGNKLESALGSLDVAQSKGQLLDNIERVRKARREAVENMKRTVEEYKRYLEGFGGAGASAPAMSREQQIEAAAARYRR
jgi:hypothetical protein